METRKPSPCKNEYKKYTQTRLNTKSQYRWRHEGPLQRCFAFILKFKAGDFINTGMYMNYKTLSNLQFRTLLENSFLSNHIDLRDTNRGETPFVSVGITRLVLIFRKTSNIHFWPKRRYKIVASKQVEILLYKRFGQQRGWGFDALAQFIGRAAISSRRVSRSSGGGGWCIKINYSEPTRAESREGSSTLAESSRVT